MRYSKDHRQQTHLKVTQAAATQFRENGIAGVGVASLMKSLGLTHGGFYAHFESKDALIEEAVDAAFDHTLNELKAYAEGAAGDQLERLVGTYLSSVHRDDPGMGCFAAAVAGELGRQSTGVRLKVVGRLNEFLTLLNEAARKDGCSVNSEALLSMMVGAIVLSRISQDLKSSESFLDAAKNALPSLAKAVGEPRY